MAAQPPDEERDLGMTMPSLHPDSIRIPAAWEAHSYCWMAWAVHPEWGDYVELVKRELREIIVTIAEFEPVRVLVPPDQIRDAQGQTFGPNVEIIEAPVDDIWMRDIAPTFALSESGLIAVDWNFNGWGSTPIRPTRPGDRLAGLISSKLGISAMSAPFIADGGAVVTDGDGTVVTTKSCLLNPNRNPAFGRTEQQRMESIEQGFSTLGIRNVIWLDGDATEPITSGHTDGYVLFTEPGKMLVEGVDTADCPTDGFREADIDLLRRSLDAQSRSLTVKTVLPPRQKYLRGSSQRTLAPCYLNAYLANGGVIAAQFGDTERDEAAFEALQQAFPTRKIRMLRIDHIASGGGGIHCVTQEMPLAGPGLSR
jgi:agmatine deiminase